MGTENRDNLDFPEGCHVMFTNQMFVLFTPLSVHEIYFHTNNLILEKAEVTARGKLTAQLHL